MDRIEQLENEVAGQKAINKCLLDQIRNYECKGITEYFSRELAAKAVKRSVSDAGYLSAYRRAINLLDDYFEYACESEKDRVRVYSILGSLTDELKRLSELDIDTKDYVY